MRSKILVCVAALTVLAAPSAWALGPGASMFAIQLTSGTADLVTPEGTSGYISAYDHSELGVQGQFWHLFSADYAVALSAGVGFFSETNEPGTNAPGGPEAKYSQSSFNVRVGGDRVVRIGDRALIYFGPGVEFWSGKATFEDIFGPGEIETETVTRISLSGRIGGTMMLSDAFGLTMHGGHRIGRANAEEAGAKATWWPSSLDAAGGVVFIFGGK